MKTKNGSFGKAFLSKKRFALVEIAIVLCSMLLLAPVISADQTTQKAITTASEDEFTLGIYGNANEDDIIDMRDTTYIKLAIFGKKPKTDLADANYDGKVSMLDVGQTKLIILGKEKKLRLIDLADRIVTIDKPVEKVVPLFNFEEYLAVEGGEDPFEKIVGWTRAYWDGRRQWTWEKYTNAFSEIEDIPDVGYPTKGTFNVEKVITLKPDVVISYEWDVERLGTAIEQLKQAGIPTIFVDYHVETLDKHTKSTLMLGYVLDKEERAQDIVDFYAEQIDKVHSRMDEIEGKPKPKVYIEGGYERWRAYAPDKMFGAIADKLGVINIATVTGQINPEQVLAAKPDVIIITGAYWPESAGWPAGTMRLGYYANPAESRELLKQQLDRPGWDTFNAVKNNRVYSIHHGSSRHIYDFFVDQYFAKSFYPDVFEDLDPEENWKEFHEKFLPVDYSGVWMLSLEE